MTFQFYRRLPSPLQVTVHQRCNSGDPLTGMSFFLNETSRGCPPIFIRLGAGREDRRVQAGGRSYFDSSTPTRTDPNHSVLQTTIAAAVRRQSHKVTQMNRASHSRTTTTRHGTAMEKTRYDHLWIIISGMYKPATFAKKFLVLLKSTFSLMVGADENQHSFYHLLLLRRAVLRLNLLCLRLDPPLLLAR